MNICGVIVQARPERLEMVRGRLDAIPGVAVHAATPEGKLIVTVEDNGAVEAADTILALHRLPDVLSATLVYHHFEPDQLSQEIGDAAKPA